ncbi:MAG: hypothetical protein AAFN11_06050 [Chloroflexota bacterium]
MKNFKFLFILVALFAGIIAVSAQDDMMTPSVTVADQVSLNGTVTIAEIVSNTPAFIVIHADNGEGAPGPVVGFRQVNQGTSVNVAVPIDTSAATTTLFAMLHEDNSEIGVYEFGTVEGADGPISVDGAVVTPAFMVETVRAYDQLATFGVVAIANVVTAQDGWVVIHADNGEGAPGPVLGQTLVTAGSNTDVAIELEGDITDVVFPMLHVDTGEAGVYEFGAVEGADGPVIVDGTVATFPITIGTPSMRVSDQIVTDTVVAESVVSEGDGWLVIHADNGEGAPGPVIGQAQVSAGTNLDVTVEIDAMGLTPVLFPMLHVDTGEIGTYEFGAVEGADGPVFVNDAVLVFPINATPFITYSGTLDGSTVTVDAAGIDVQGWLVIHADNGEGAPGPVLGQTPIVPGVNTDIAVELEGEITETLFPMLHVDTGEAGVYEFGAVEGADGPVFVADAVVTGPMMPETMME